MKNIIQEIKDCCSIRINCGKCGSCESVYFIPKSIISKLELAVAKMETTTSTCKDSLQVGDMAAMREALNIVIDSLKALSEIRALKFPKEVKSTLGKMAFHVITALNEPPRNCDRFGGDPKMLYTAWFDWTASPSGINDDGTVKLTYGEWLLERAKGGAHAAC